MFDSARFNGEPENGHSDEDSGKDQEELDVVEGEVDVLGGDSDCEDCDEMPDEGAFNEFDFVWVGLVVYAVGDGVGDGERVVGEFHL